MSLATFSLGIEDIANTNVIKLVHSLPLLYIKKLKTFKEMRFFLKVKLTWFDYFSFNISSNGVFIV